MKAGLADAAFQTEAEQLVRLHGKLDGQLLLRTQRADQPFIEGKQVVKGIVVPDKLVNIVVK